jgi:hypothetical protein
MLYLLFLLSLRPTPAGLAELADYLEHWEADAKA